MELIIDLILQINKNVSFDIFVTNKFELFY